MLGKKCLTVSAKNGRSKLTVIITLAVIYFQFVLSMVT